MSKFKNIDIKVQAFTYIYYNMNSVIRILPYR